MSSASLQPEIAAALTVTIESTSKVTYVPASGTVPMGGLVRFRSGNHSRWEVQLWNATNDDPHPLRLFVPEHGGAVMIADPEATPADVNFNVLTFPGGKGSPAEGGTYKITITSTEGGK